MEHNHAKHSYTQNNYLPLIVVIVLITATAAVTSIDQGVYAFVVHFMAGFFLVFGGLKLLSLREFVDGYALYDLLAARWRGYGYVYPFIEIAFGFSMLSGFHPDWLLLVEAALMLFSGIGVLFAIRKQNDIQCVCLGSALNVPLTYVTLVENMGMMTLAIALILW
ncbi:MAG: hypothetical protein F4X82_02290 [Candidatus Spechtbacteria bacterium SB0662_bin_43]|uniref:Methylamine utilisation protein MauE domain-containing protein n=1 Tax=Candidatus Spechtbacteria bacterium SB0662_bin_43 TaxID=2604897 RepID=A0A845DCD8_9BACT|nr:hypothetical protein [Candidatus Spechtbacteria bacterium SB0662_bin_43]